MPPCNCLLSVDEVDFQEEKQYLALIVEMIIVVPNSMYCV